MFDKVKSKVIELSKNKHFKVGLPILILVVVSSLEFKEFSSLRYLFRPAKTVDEEVWKLVKKTGGPVTLESEYEKMKNMDINNWTNKRVPDSLISRLENYDKSGANLYHYDLVIKLNKEFPYDVGIFCIYWLNYIVLEPGEAIYLAANEPHAYLSGDCIECMANSDNVIRAGLTPKFRDVGTLCDMLSYNNFTPSEFVLSPIREKEGTMLFSPPINDFSLARVTVPANKEYTLIERASSSILLVMSGRATTDSGKYLREGSVLYLPSNRKFSVKTEEDLIIFQAFCNV